MTTLQQILRRERHLVRVVKPSYDIQAVLNYSLFAPEQRADWKDLASVLQWYINLPCLCDNFRNHGDRMQWIEEMYRTIGPEFDQLHRQNALHANNFAAVKYHLSGRWIMESYRGQNKEQIQSIIDDILGRCSKEGRYNTLSTTQKLAFVAGIKHQMRALLGQIAHKI